MEFVKHITDKRIRTDFIKRSAREYDRCEDTSPWNKQLAAICSSTSFVGKFNYNTMSNEFTVHVDELLSIEDVLDYLEDEIRYKSFYTIYVIGKAFSLRFRKYFRLTEIDGEDIPSVGYISIKKSKIRP